MDIESLLMSALGTFFGCLVTIIVAKIVFVRSTKDLKKMNKKLKLILRGLEVGEIVEWNKDSKGEPIGVVIRLKAESGSYKFEGSPVELRKVNRKS